MARVFKVRIRNASGFGVLFKPIHFRHNTEIHLADGATFISDPAKGQGFEEGDRMLLAFDDFNERLKLFQEVTIDQNFFDIVINPTDIDFGFASMPSGGAPPF